MLHAARTGVRPITGVFDAFGNHRRIDEIFADVSLYGVSNYAVIRRMDSPRPENSGFAFYNYDRNSYGQHSFITEP